MAAGPDPNIGRDLLGGQFQILQKIGSGGMGSVYKATQPAMNRMVAVKILHPKLANRKDLVSRFRREARAMSHLTHPNTVKVLLYGELEDGSLYIVMEYLEGRNLNQVVRKEGPLPVERAIPILIQVCGALQEAHMQGIVHRDLKPENIFLSTNGGLKDYPKVLDFGLAKVTEREMRPGSVMLTQEGMVFGTPEFMSPEQAQGKVLDARSDIYSLATILYEVLTGKLPFEARTPMEYIQHHVTKSPILLDSRIPGKSFPPGLGVVLARALEKRPEDRFDSASEFAEALKPFAGGAGKGYTAMMPKNADLVLEQATKQHAAALEAAKPPASSPSPFKSPAKTVKMVNTPSPSSKSASKPQPQQAPVVVTAKPLLLVGIAAGCLLAGILITIVAMKLLG
jgi:eukaryotic-like serine/threonine-protein kinase